MGKQMTFWKGKRALGRLAGSQDTVVTESVFGVRWVLPASGTKSLQVAPRED